MRCKLFVFRHAQTFDNKNKVFSGWRNSKLTHYGIEQAHLTKYQLRKEKIDYAFASHQKRSRDTLRIVLEGHKKIPIFTDDRIIERCYGSLQGTSKTKIEKEKPKWYLKIHRGYNNPPPKGESLKMVSSRTESFLHELITFLKKHPGNVAISCHGNSMRPIRRHFERLSVKQMCKIENPQDKSMIYTVNVNSNKISRGKWKKLVLNKKVRLTIDKRNVLRKHY